MRSLRYSIAGLMGVVLIAALAAAALGSGSEAWAGATFLTTCAVLCLAIVGAVCRGGAERAWWLGFALFGWGYLGLILSDVYLPTIVLAETLGPLFGGGPGESFSQVIHGLCTLLAATLGGVLARLIIGNSMSSLEARAPEAPPAPRAPQKWWRRWQAIAVATLIVAACVSVIAIRWAPAHLAAAAYFSTWGLLCLSAVGAVCNRGKRRAAWLGAALFGAGYMALIFGHDPHSSNYWPQVATDQVMGDLRSSFLHSVRVEAPVWYRDVAANARVLEALERPIPLRFRDGVPLEDLLKAIQNATRGREGIGIPIHVDPIGLLEAEKTMQSTVSIDLEVVPLRTSLRYALSQLGMRFRVKDGMLVLDAEVSDSGPEFPSAHEDPFLVVGHCLLALLAAGIGGSLAPLVCEQRNEPSA